MSEIHWKPVAEARLIPESALKDICRKLGYDPDVVAEVKLLPNTIHVKTIEKDEDKALRFTTHRHLVVSRLERD